MMNFLLTSGHMNPGVEMVQCHVEEWPGLTEGHFYKSAEYLTLPKKCSIGILKILMQVKLLVSPEE